MNQLVNVFRSEVVKFKHTSIIWLLFIMPVVVTYLYGAYYYPLALIKSQPSWEYFTGRFFSINAYGLILPVVIAVGAAAMSGLESSDNCWNRCFVLPVPRWMVYCVKLLLVHYFTLVNLIVSGLCLIVFGLKFNQLYPEQAFTDMIPWVQCLKLIFSFYIGSLAVIAVQMWISMKFRVGSAGISIGVGMLLITYYDYILSHHTMLHYFNPWMIDLSIFPLGLTGSLLTRAVLGILLSSAIGFWVNSRFEVA